MLHAERSALLSALTRHDAPPGRGSYCPWGTAVPISCGPKGTVDPVLGPANGPAFLTDVAACRNHCYNGAPGQLSTCEGMV